MDLPTEPNQVMRMVDTGKYAYLTDTTILEFTAVTSCGKYTRADYIFAVGGLAFALGKNKPYMNEINYK